MIARKSALVVATNIVNGLLGYIALFFITRNMSPSDYGLVQFAFGFVTLFSVFATFGFHGAHIKKISEGKDLGTCIGTFFVTKIGLTGLMMSVIMIFIIIWKVFLGRGFETGEHEIAIYIMMLYWTINSFTGVFINTFKAKQEIAKAAIPAFFETFVRVIATIIVALAGMGAIALAFTYIAGEVFYFLSGAYLFRKYPIKKPSFIYFKDYLKFAIPLIIVTASNLIITQIDKVLIQLFWADQNVGYYSSIVQLTVFMTLFTVAISTLLFPTYSSLHKKDDIKSIKKLTFKSERYLSMIVFPMVFGTIILAGPIVHVLLSNWSPAIPVLQILPLFVLFQALEGPYQSQFLGMNKPNLARNRVLIMVIINIVLNIILIPKDIQLLGLKLAGLGEVGASIATVIAFAAGLFYSRIMAWKLTNIKGNSRIFLHAISAGFMAMVIYWLNIFIHIGRWYQLLGFVLFGMLIYFFILYLLKEFDKNDFYFFADTLNFKKMIRYIYDEIKRK